MAFGKADIGLIKSTAGAEAGLSIDQNLATGAVLGSAINSINAKAQVQADINAGLEKEIQENFNTVTGNPSKQMMDEISRITPGFKERYVGLKGNSVASRQAQAFVTDDYNGIIQQIDSITGILSTNADQKTFGPGSNGDHEYFNNALSGGNYLIETTSDPTKNNGYTQVNVAVPKRVEPNPETYGKTASGVTVAGINKMLSDDPNAVLTDEMKDLKNRYTKATKSYNDWKDLPEKVDGRYNTEKYQIYNEGNMPRKGQSYENKTKLFSVYNNNVSKKTTSTHLQKINIGTASQKATQWKASLEDVNGMELQHAMFGDFSEDEIDNSFASIFIKGAKDESMYKDLNGNPLVFSFGNESEAVTYGSDEWKDKSSEEQEDLKEKYLRGYGTDGTINPDQNSVWVKEKYSKFMGEVTQDAVETKRIQHFDAKGLYFNDGSGGIDVFNTKAAQQGNKKKAYTTTRFDAAFPQTLLNNADLKNQLSDGGNGTKALTNMFDDFDVEYKIKKGIVTVDGETYDFTGDDKEGELARLKKYMKTAEPKDANFDIDLGNDINGQGWQALRDEKYNYYGGNVDNPNFDSGANLPRDINGNIITSTTNTQAGPVNSQVGSAPVL